jgi:hypothetical protein
MPTVPEELKELKELNAQRGVAIASAEYVLTHASSPPCELHYDEEGESGAFIQFIWKNRDWVSLGGDGTATFQYYGTGVDHDCDVGSDALLAFLGDR